MTLDVSLTGTEYAGAMVFRHAEIDVEYDEGGEDFIPADLNMNRFQNVIITVESGDAVGVSWDSTADTLTVYDLVDGTEVAEDTEVSLRVTGIGR